ncbi:MAG TPA: lytic transglycosylase domain-containing protein [Puia sp.]|jgi:hypothetical protein|nr:lytic transglycosylase domain-containing protein [Puia sp.]
MLKTQFTHAFYLCNSFLLISTSFTANTVSSDANTFLKEEELTECHFSGTGNEAGGNTGRSLDFYHADKSVRYHSIGSEIKLNRKGMQFVKRYIKNSSESLGSVRRRSLIPFFIIDSVFNRYGLPVELKYLAVIESELKPSAISQVGALGPWQLMPATARDLGLKITKQTDERTDYYKSTSAAAKYLRDLYAQFDDWLLVLAAYNGGPKPVYTAIRESGSKNFWALQDYLPAESREHVKKFIATHYYFEGHGSETTSTRAENAAYKKAAYGIAKSKPASEFSQSKKVKSKPTSTAHKSGNLAIHQNLKQSVRSENSGRKNQNIAGQFETSEQKFRRVMKQSEESLKRSRKII